MLTRVPFLAPGWLLPTFFGSDTPFDGDSQKRVIDRVKNMDLSDIEKEQILGGNLARILSL